MFTPLRPPPVTVPVAAGTRGLHLEHRKYFHHASRSHAQLILQREREGVRVSTPAWVDVGVCVRDES